MRKTRVFIDSVLKTGESLTLDGDTAHYLGRVLKVRQGNPVTVFNGRGGSYQAEITAIDRRTITLSLLQFDVENNESPLRVTLAQGISRGQHMDYTVQKAVELGVTRIVPLFSEYSNVRLEEERARKRYDHWHKIITSACEQSGRNLVPQLDEAQPLSDWVQQDGASLKLIMHPEANDSLAGLLEGITDLTILCGPEGGLSPVEINIALAQGYRKVSMGPRIMRTETAAIAAIAICQAMQGDMLYNRRPVQH